MTMTDDVPGCEVMVYKAGLLSAFGHDLLLRATDVEIDVAQRVAIVNPSSLRVVAAMRAGRRVDGQLSARDKRDIERSLRDEVLDVNRFAAIRFSWHAWDPGARVATGDLELRGYSAPIALHFAKRANCFVAEVRIHQPLFGIKPYATALGALRIQPDVTVVIRLSQQMVAALAESRPA